MRISRYVVAHTFRTPNGTQLFSARQCLINKSVKITTMKYLLLSITIILLSCSNDNDVDPLAGKWVEKVNGTATITFDTELDGNASKYFIFKYDKGISGYNDLHSAIYQYKIENDKISIYNTLSSCYCFADYSFTQTGDKIFIENFYDSNSKGVIETFTKLK